MKNRLFKTFNRAAILLVAAASVQGATDLATSPLVTSSTSSVLPNLLFVLDDSGSMGWSYLPDWANDTDPFTASSYTNNPALNRNNGFNGVAYSPSVTYSPPAVYNTDGTLNTTTYPSQTSANTTAWTVVKNDGYGIQSTSNSNITASAYYYTFIPGEFCDNPNLRTCTTATATSTTYPYPATLRWCDSSALTTCKASWVSGTYTYPRYPKQATTTIVVSGSTSSTVSSIKVNALEILSATTTASTSSSTVASEIVAKINACLPAITGSCQVAGYSAYSSGSTVTINAPVTAGNITYTPVVIKSGTMTVTPGTFSGYSVPGVNFRRDIVSDNDSYPYPGDTAKASSRTDCAGATCTYAEEMTNFANWWAYYRTRMQMMKTSASNAFSSIGSTYRVGYMSINNNTSSDFLNISPFDITQKRSWYSKLFAAIPNNSTPLREALSKAGRLYSGKLNGTTFNGSTVTDPMQYSCQQNFTIFSTDGYWNGNAGFKVDGSTAVGNQDGSEARPQNDGGSASYNRSTSQLQYSQTQLNTSTSQTASRTTQIQSSTSALQSNTGTLQQKTGTLQWQTKQQQTTGALRRATNLQQTTSTLNRATNLQQTTASLLRSTKLSTFTATTWTLEVSNTSGGTYSNASASTTYTCITSGTGSGTNKYCRLKSGSSGSTTGLSSCTVNYNNPGSTPTNSSRKVITACTEEWSTASAVGASGTCIASATVRCSAGTTATAYVTNYPPTCSVNFNSAGSNTADASGKVITACPTSSYSTAAAVGAGGSCNGSLANVQCSTSSATTAYVTNYPPTCSVSYSSGGANTANSSGKVVTACPTSSYGTAAAVGAGGACNGSLANVQCSTATTTSSYVTSNPPACSITYTSSAANTADGSGNVVTACPVSGTFSGWTNVSTGGSCTSSANVGCQYSWSGWSTAASCTVNQSSGTGAWSITSGTDCRYSWTGLVNAGSCTTVAADAGPAYSVGTARQCAYAAWTAYGNTSTCTALAQSPASPYTVGTATQCQTTDTGWVGTTSCTASALSGGREITCQTTTTGPTPSASCTAQTAAAGNSWVQRTCPNTVISAAVGTASCTADAPTLANNYVSTNCNTVTTGPTASSTCTAATAASSNNYTATTCSVASTTGGTSNTLSDVAQYYYATDLRTSALSNCTGVVVAPATVGNDVCSNDVPTNGQDGASWQHMTTFTLGLGVNGYMQFSPSYATATSGDYFDVKNATTANPTGGICSWQASGVCNWPTPSSDSQANIDDLWHAAVNGRGTYFSATSPSTLSAGLSSALAGVSARQGSSAAATTSNPNVTSGDNFVFSSTFTTQEWVGQLFRQQIDLSTGSVPVFDLSNTTTYDWASQAQLDINTGRTIYTYDSSTANKLKLFTWANLTTGSTGEQSYFNTANIATLSQFCSSGVTCLSAASQTAAAGSNLLSYLIGDRTNEGVSTDISKYYRQRTHILGDIVNAEAVYVKSALFEYADAGYSDFKTAKATRQGMVYAAANDGMLHAFNSTTGAESWTYVPSLMLPNLFKLADKNYSALHQYYVDGTPISGDICSNASSTACTAGEWKTMLVGGLNRGGRGYYALDVTDPASPKAMWEFTDDDMGYTYGNPIITKYCSASTTDTTTGVITCTTKTWVVLVTSGYNNTSPGDGAGRLYVLNANTGALIRTISTGVGSTTTPSGLARINAWVESAMSDNTTERVYGGDMLGNIWRFDINNNVGASGYEAERLTTLYSNTAGTVAQPVTTKPELGEVGGYPTVFVGTGRYLGTTDLSDTSQQSFYAVKDRLGTAALTPFTNPRATGSGFVAQIQTVGTCPTGTPTTICTAGQSVRTSTSNPVNFATDNGWYVDLPDSGERDNTDPTLALGTLGFNTNVPNVSACTAGGYSYRYFLDYRTGAAVSTSTTQVVGARLGNALATRAVFVRLPNNTVVQLTRMSDGSTTTTNVPIGNGGGSTRRVSWRELVTGQ